MPQKAEAMGLIVARPIEILSYIIYPIVKMFEGITAVVMRIVGAKGVEKLTEEEIRTIVSLGRQEKIIKKDVGGKRKRVIKYHINEDKLEIKYNIDS